MVQVGTMDNSNDGILAWHFIQTRGKLRDGSAAQERGLEVSPVAPQICESGLHASVRALDALTYAPGSIIRRVRVYGDLQTQGDKVCGLHREVLWTADATSALRLFAADCAESVFEFIKDEESKLTAAWSIGAARRFARGEADEEELAAAHAAAWDATRYATYAAACAGAGYAARHAAKAAANIAAHAAAWGAAMDAAKAAAWNAAWDAASDAAYDAAWERQNKLLTKYLMELKPL